MKKVMFSPSVLDSDFTKIASTLKMLEEQKMDFVHFDVMDGNFVPNLTFGPRFIKYCRPHTKTTFDVHLMINNPDKYAEEFAKAGSDYITFHAETVKDPAAVIKQIKSYGKKVGMSVKPKTPVKELFPYVENLDLILIMSVEPGFGGQKFMEYMLEKSRELRKIIDNNKYNCILEIDGGINKETAPKAVAGGIDALVAGSAIFGAPDPIAAIAALREAVK